MRRLAFAVVVLIGSLAFVAPTAAASATSWRATIVGEHLHGGATTLITSDGRGTISVKLYGVPAGQPVAVAVNPAACPTEAESLFSFLTLEASSEGIATGKLQLTPGQVTAYDAALSARTKLSILAVTSGDKGCGDQVGAPSVGTGRLQGSMSGVYAYDLRYPVVGGVESSVGTAVNDVLRAGVDATVAAFVQQATNAADPSIEGVSKATQTFSVSLSQTGLLSLGERYIPDVVGAPHGDDSVFTFTFDLATGHRLTLAELFRPGVVYLDVLSAAANPILARRIGAIAGAVTAPAADHFAAWQLAPTGLRISFGQLQGFGVPVTAITIPWATLRPNLNLRSPIARLLSPGPCLASQLAGTMSDWDAGAGSRFNTVHLTNVSLLRCWLQGTPQSQVIDGTGHVLLDSATAGASGLPHISPGDPRVNLAPFASARIDIAASNYCGPIPPSPIRIALRLTPGGGRVIAVPPAGGSTADDLPPCNGPGVPGSVTTNGWHHA